MKKIILAIVVVLFILLATVNVYIGKSGETSILTLLNIEAIASGESGEGQASCTCTKDCGDGATASCTGYEWCQCGVSGGLYLICDGITARCD